jgi:hypothetical protein
MNKMCICYLHELFTRESIYGKSEGANSRFQIAAIYPSVNLQPFIKIPKIDTQHYILIVALRYLMKKGVMYTTFDVDLRLFV